MHQLLFFLHAHRTSRFSSSSESFWGQKRQQSPRNHSICKAVNVTDCRVHQARWISHKVSRIFGSLQGGSACPKESSQIKPCFWRCVIGPRTGRVYDFSSSAAMGEDRHQIAVGVCPYNPSSTNRRALFFSKVSKNASLQEPVLKTCEVSLLKSFDGNFFAEMMEGCC